MAEQELVKQSHPQSRPQHDENSHVQQSVAAVDCCERFDLEDDLEFHRQLLAHAAVVPAFFVLSFVDTPELSSHLALPLESCLGCSNQYRSTILPQQFGA